MARIRRQEASSMARIRQQLTQIGRVAAVTHSDRGVQRAAAATDSDRGVQRATTATDSDRGLDTRLRRGREADGDILRNWGELGVTYLWVAAAGKVL